jgi:hypothetical protein
MAAGEKSAGQHWVVDYQYYQEIASPRIILNILRLIQRLAMTGKSADDLATLNIAKATKLSVLHPYSRICILKIRGDKRRSDL